MIDGIGHRRTFAALRSEGVRVRSGPLGATFLASPDARGGTQVAFAIPKRVGGAVQRNRLRRRLRAILAEMEGRGFVPAGAMLVVAGPKAASRGTEELRSDVKRLLMAIERALPVGYHR